MVLEGGVVGREGREAVLGARESVCEDGLEEMERNGKKRLTLFLPHAIGFGKEASVSDVHRGITNTRSVVSELHQNVASTRTIVADIRRSVVGSLGEADSKHRSVSFTRILFNEPTLIVAQTRRRLATSTTDRSSNGARLGITH